MKTVGTEQELLASFLARQRDAFRRAVAGLDEAQARSVPSASSMSMAVLLKHAIDGERTMTDRLAGTVPATAAADPVATWQAGWHVAEDETIDVLLRRWADVAARTEAVLRGQPDMTRVVQLPPDVTRWLPSELAYTVRWLVVHEIEELARHAGHADIIRESIDGRWAMA